MLTAKLEFLNSGCPKPVYHMQDNGAEFRSTGTYCSQDVFIEDGRQLDEKFSIDSHGFELVPSATSLSDLDC